MEVGGETLHQGGFVSRVDQMGAMALLQCNRMSHWQAKQLGLNGELLRFVLLLLATCQKTAYSQNNNNRLQNSLTVSFP